MADILVDTDGDGTFDKDLGGALPDITDESGDGKLDVNITAELSSSVINGAIFSDAASVGAGTGNYNTFLALQDDNEDDATTGNDSDGVETGFNAGQSDGGAQANPEDDTNDEMDASKSEAILLGAIPIKIVNGVAYYEFRVDLNEANSGSDTLISLDQFQLYVGPYDLDGDPPNPDPATQGQNDPNVDLVDTFSEVQSLTKVYDMDAGNDVSVLMDEANSSGSGNDDYVVLVPVANFAGLDVATTYVYLYVQMGAAGGDGDGDGAIGDVPGQNNVGDSQTWVVNGGFHEWNLQNALIIQGTKFNDLDGDGQQDPGEPGLAGVTVYIDDNLNGVVDATDNNGVLDASEQFDITDVNGNYSFGGIPIFDTDYTIYIREVVPAGQVPTTTLPVAVLIDSGADAGSIIGIEDFPGLLIGNHVLTPHVTITKDASGYGDCADTVGETILYTITVDNDGELDLTNVVLSDNFEGGGDVTLVVTGLGGNGVLDVGEVVRTGDDGDGILETNETWTYQYLRAVTQAQIDSDGGGDGALTDTATVNADSVNGSVSDDDDAIVEVCQDPAIMVVKDASGYGECADTVGETITYTYTVTNEGNVSLENVDLTDDFSDGVPAYVSGDDDADGELDVDETWTYTAEHVVTQDDIDDGGNYDSDDPADGINDSIRNVATVTGDAVTTGEEVTDDDDAIVEVCQDPAIMVVKNVRTDQSGGYVPADNPSGPVASTSSTVDFQVIVANTGNVSLENVTLTDTVDHNAVETDEVIDYNLIGAEIDIDNDGTIDGLWSDYDEDQDGTLDDADGNFATVDDFILAPGASFAVYYSLDSALGQHENTAVVTADAVTTGTDVTAEDDANYYVVESADCVGVRTPGFWSNPKWMTFWDGKGEGWGTPANEPSQAGTPGFADGELLYATDSNDDGFINFKNGDGINDDKPLDAKGLLIGDYNMNGFTDGDEDTIFIDYNAAVKLINASSKQLNAVDSKTADGIYMLGRDMVATWLNYLANNEETTGECIGSVADDGVTSVREYLDGAIDWMQALASDDNNNSGEDQSVFQFDARVAPNSSNWQSAISGVPFSGAEMHSQLDAYNNTGKINGIEYCCDADSQLVLSVLGQINLV